MTTQFDNIYHDLEPQLGKFRMAASGMAWMNNETREVVSVPAAEIKWASWMRVARNFRLRIGLKEKGRRENFDGFMRDDHDKLTGLMKQHYGIILENKEISFKGWNWGATDFQGQDLAFLVSNKTAFELPLQKVANSNIAGRTEVSLEFATSAGRPSRGAGDELVEIRFYVPGTQIKDIGSDAGEEQVEDEEETSAAQAFHDAVKEKAELGEVTGNVIVNFEEVLVLTPRGRYDVDMFPEFLRLRGKTYDYKINYDGISKLFLLPKDDQHVLFILSLVNPIRQGQTRYHFLVMQFDREEEIRAELNIEEFVELAKYEKLQKHYEASSFEVISSIFRALSKNKIIGSGSFSSRTGHPGIKANLKAVQGDLFILEKYLFFVAKAPLLIELSDIHQVNFSRVGGPMATSRTFDLVVVTKSGPEHTFSSLNKEEHEGIEGYLKGKKLRVKNTMAEDLAPPVLDDDDEDEEMQSVVSSGEEVPRPRIGGEDDDSEEDEDFHASDSDSGSPTSDSDSDSEGAASVSDASGDRDIARTTKNKKKKKAAGDKEKPKKKAKAKAKAKSDEEDGDAAAMSVDEDEPKAKPQPKPRPKAKTVDGEDGPAKKKQKKD
ncbi:SSrecog-domain-containing protein [Fomitiporia mediterranea MF3/22]|uniref:SSrecog-domain-containing protein n=1 Tax=Fomitiporia mediterranea (strain MF3/22) TaxID=694068 RepID=UPI00044072FF|nr:SSrecog-domain-containing protein [Fomitiporia mediterranea MF3/22]EJC97814.1 SSrecog-domain-containing protein [Fomitiporia mediterranea MF3/22]